MVFTDPPYNVAYGAHGGQAAGAPARRLVNDAMPAEAWQRFCRAWAGGLTANVAGAMYICMSSKEWPSVCRALAEAGAHWSDTIIWAKDRFTLGRADYQRQYEPIWYGWPEGRQRHWQGGRDQGDVWQIPRPDASPLHPTQKPLELVERAIENARATASARRPRPPASPHRPERGWESGWENGVAGSLAPVTIGSCTSATSRARPGPQPASLHACKNMLVYAASKASTVTVTSVQAPVSVRVEPVPSP